MNKFNLVFQYLEEGEWHDMPEISQFAMTTLAEYACDIQNGYRPFEVSNRFGGRENARKVTRLRVIAQLFQ